MQYLLGHLAVRIHRDDQGACFYPSALAVFIDRAAWMTVPRRAAASFNQQFVDEIVDGTVVVVQAAVSDANGTIDFYMEESAGETSSLISQHSSQFASKIIVKVETIDNYVINNHIEFVDFLKIDAEGYDLHVIKGASRCLNEKKIGVIQFEYNLPWRNACSTLRCALDILAGSGYNVYILKKDGLHLFDYNLFGEFYGYSNFVAVLPKFIELSDH